MNQTAKLSIERKPEVLARTGLTRSTLHRKIKDGTFPPPINLGGRAIGFVSGETDAWISAMAAGKTEDEVKELVRSLIASRRAAA